MTKEDLRELKKYFKEIYPHVWEHYKFLYNRRISDINKKGFFIIGDPNENTNKPEKVFAGKREIQGLGGFAQALRAGST